MQLPIIHNTVSAHCNALYGATHYSYSLDGDFNWRVLVTIIALGSCTPEPGTSHKGGWGVAHNHNHHQLQWKSLYDWKERSADGPTHRGKKGGGIMP